MFNQSANQCQRFEYPVISQSIDAIKCPDYRIVLYDHDETMMKKRKCNKYEWIRNGLPCSKDRSVKSETFSQDVSHNSICQATKTVHISHLHPDCVSP